MYDKYLPLGSIIVLKDSNKKLMITGYGMVSNNVVYDYASCTYPSGYAVLDETNLFNHDDIDNVLFIGYRTLEQERYNEKIIQQSLEANTSKIEEKPELNNDQYQAVPLENQNVMGPQILNPEISANPEQPYVVNNNEPINNYVDNNIQTNNQNFINTNNQQTINNVPESNQSNVIQPLEEQQPSYFSQNLFNGMMNNSPQNNEIINQNIPVTNEEADEMFRE